MERRKHIIEGREAREGIKRGINRAADILKGTLGPMPRNVLLGRFTDRLYPLVADDGAFIISELDFDDPAENTALAYFKEVAQKTDARVGDGTTTATVLARAIYNKAHDECVVKKPTEVKQIILDGLKLALDELKKIAKEIKQEKEILFYVAKTSAKNEE